MAILVVAILVNSCKKEETNTNQNNNNNSNTPTTPTGMVKIGETYILGAKTKAYIYAAQAPFVGYNTFYAAMYDSVDGTQITDGHFNLSAEMDMGMMKHNCPVETNEDINATTKLFSTSMVFIMPGTMGWTLNIDFHNHKNDLEGVGSLPIQVVESKPVRMMSTVLPLDDSSKVFVSFVLPTKAKVGLNDAEFTIHEMASNTSFPAITDYTIEMIPTMPSMGHGSPNNVNPVHTSEGHYTGKLNFTMSGLWEIQLKLYKNGVLLTDKLKFEITL